MTSGRVFGAANRQKPLTAILGRFAGWFGVERGCWAMRRNAAWPDPPQVTLFTHFVTLRPGLRYSWHDSCMCRKISALLYLLIRYRYNSNAGARVTRHGCRVRLAGACGGMCGCMRVFSENSAMRVTSLILKGDFLCRGPGRALLFQPVVTIEDFGTCRLCGEALIFRLPVSWWRSGIDMLRPARHCCWRSKGENACSRS